ncbi:MAG: bifunctional phosphoglucose/phosphomannose isomerase [Flavobacteriales bacterium]|jgi:glucose/mannose-6-phosphate isomerase|nr:bifunctional phosphoglucose/phosphomannose isomerase [Flavobacteriales bacterium]MDG1797910.1 bifunctional phosphoglucose/phosphomannose isomerase [Flavobacteriales bacterium]
MRRLVKEFTSQLTEALEIGKNTNLKAPKNTINNIVITGLGGSGIGGKIATQLVADQLKVPAVINNDYSLPKFVNENTLVIVSSFSGNTEETLEALKSAQKANAEIACITAGGKLAQIANDNNYNLLVLPTAFSPRAMLTYSVIQQLFLFHHYGFINNEFIDDTRETVKLLDNEVDDIMAVAKQTANALFEKTTVAYSEASMEGVITRFRQQINENSKSLAWEHVFPEMNHNELVGWAGGKDEYAVLIFRSSFEHSRSSVRINISKDIFRKYTSTVLEFNAKGDTLLAQSFYHILLGDWISVYLAELNKVDDVEVKVIDFLKAELAKI